MRPAGSGVNNKLWSLVIAGCVSIAALGAVESQPVKVLTVDSGLRLTVEASLGGFPVSVAVQLEHIALLGDAQFSRQMLRDLCPVGSLVVLRVPEPALTADSFGIVHAVVVRGFERMPDSAQARTGPFAEGPVPCIVQVALARAGWAVAAPQSIPMPPDLSQQLQQAEREAKARKLGSHSLPDAAVHEPGAPSLPVVEASPARAGSEPAAERKHNPF